MVFGALVITEMVYILTSVVNDEIATAATRSYKDSTVDD